DSFRPASSAGPSLPADDSTRSATIPFAGSRRLPQNRLGRKRTPPVVSARPFEPPVPRSWFRHRPGRRRAPHPDTGPHRHAPPAPSRRRTTSPTPAGRPPAPPLPSSPPRPAPPPTATSTDTASGSTPNRPNASRVRFATSAG